MAQPMIIPMNTGTEARFYSLAAEYLPGSDPEHMHRFTQLYPEAFLTLQLDDQIIGVAYGWFRRHFAPEDPSFTLDGICIEYDHWRKGYGSLLLRAFEDAAKTYGAQSVSVGSAGGFVEQFYIACGYQPKEYKVWTDGVPMIEHIYTDLEDYRTYKRENPEGFVVMEKRF